MRRALRTNPKIRTQVLAVVLLSLLAIMKSPQYLVVASIHNRRKLDDGRR